MGSADGARPEEAASDVQGFPQEAMDEEVEIATQACEVEAPLDEKAEKIMETEAGRQYFLLWKSGQLDDGAVAWSWGRFMPHGADSRRAAWDAHLTSCTDTRFSGLHTDLLVV